MAYFSMEVPIRDGLERSAIALYIQPYAMRLR